MRAILLCTLLPLAALGACAGPESAGQQVGQSLYQASVSTGHALAVAGDRTGAAFQNAGSSLRNAVNPPPPGLYDRPPPYVPDGETAPVGTGPNPAVGY